MASSRQQVLDRFLDKIAFDYKLACDGWDLYQKPIGELLNLFAVAYVKRHCRIETFNDIEQFVIETTSDREKAPNFRGLSTGLVDKYEVGYFETSVGSCFDSDYILFNKEQLQFWETVGVHLFGLKFMVCPSRNKEGTINEIGFRLLNQEQVNNAFKWLFVFGQQGTFGLHLCDISKKLLLCEGFLDMIAFRESGYSNTVGLGSVTLTKGHEEQLAGYKWIFCQDMDSFGMFSRKDDLDKTCFYYPQGKDPYEVWKDNGWVKVIVIDNDI